MAKRETEAGVPVSEPSDPGNPIETAPKDGRWIEVTENHVTWHRVRFYKTRVRMSGHVNWVEVSCWSTTEPSKYAFRIDGPVAWRWPKTAEDKPEVPPNASPSVVKKSEIGFAPRG